MDQRTELAALRIAANKLLQACDVVPNGSLSAEFVRETFKDSLPEAATAMQSGGEVVAETMISHAREPHCIGCYVIRWNDGELVAQCNECGATVALLDGLASPAQPSGFGEVCIVCDWKDANPFPRFIEAEVDGRSVRFDWRDRTDGLKELVIQTQGEKK